MRLLRIRMRNFCSWVEEDIDLSLLDSATIGGLNGHGKSSGFIDAPLWALFGKCRVDSNSMIRLGCDQMSVEIDFSLDSQTYKVKRFRSISGKTSKSLLSFLVSDGGGSLMPIGGSKIAETQEAICSVLNADYDLFVNTSFLLQGKADQFTKATASERKTIMAQVLKLDEYSELKRRAAAQATGMDAAHHLLREERERLNTEASGPIIYSQAIAKIQAEIERASSQQLLAQQELENHGNRVAKAEMKIEEVVRIRVEVSQLNAKLAKLAMNRKYRESDLAAFKSKAENEAEIKADQGQLKLLRQEKDYLEGKVIGLREGMKIKGKLAQELAKKRGKEADTLGRIKVELQTIHHNVERIHERKAIEIKSLKEDLERDTVEAQLLTKVPCWKELQEQCQFTIKAIEKQQSLPLVNERIKELERLDVVAQEMPNFEKDKEHRELQIKLLLQTGTETLRAAAALVWEETAEEIDREEKVLRQYAHKEKDLVASVERLGSIEAAKQGVTQTLQAIEDIEAQIKEYSDQVALKSGFLESGEELLAWYEKREETEKSLLKNKAIIDGVLDITQEQLTHARADYEKAKMRAVRLDEISKQIVEILAKQALYTKLKELYAIIPVSIMEQSVPLLELAANEILEQISPTGMRVRFDTQKALKSSDKIAETLDIVVRDVFGERAYENYSGGEKFRIDLAVRFGLSRLLANRAGSQIQTLVIDEGLGSLDREGLDLLRECLSKLESSFGLILVISHVEGIKGTFPSSIFVNKNEEGSHAIINS